MDAAVEDDRRSDGETLCKSLRLKKEDTDDRRKWRKGIRVADPFPGRDYSNLKEKRSIKQPLNDVLSSVVFILVYGVDRGFGY